MRLPPAEAESEGPNLTPVIDIVFLLLIFFLVATQFDEEEREIATRLAEVVDAQPLTKPPQELIVNILQEGTYKVHGKIYQEEALGQLLHDLSLKNPHQSVQIRADERVPFRYPARVMSLCEGEHLNHRCSVKLSE